MEAGPSLRCCGDKRNPETPTPIAKQISQAGGFVVLVGAQLRIGDEVHRDQKEAIPKSLKSPYPTEMRTAGIEVCMAVQNHRDGDAGQTHHD
jgi:hypothetical protein